MRQVAQRNFSGGLNTTDNPMELDPSELQRCDNFFIDKRGQLYRRRGYVRVASVPNAVAIIGLHRYYNTHGSGYLLVVTANNAYVFADGGGMISQDARYSNRDRSWMVNLRGLVICPATNTLRLYRNPDGGGNGLWRQPYWDRPTMVSEDAQSKVFYTTPAPDTNQLYGRYRWKTSEYGPLGEGPMTYGYIEKYSDTGRFCTELNAFTLPVSPYASGRYIWRAPVVNSNEGTYRLVTIIPNNIGTAYLDNVPDYLLGDATSDCLPGDGVATQPDWPAGPILALFGSRLFAVDATERSKVRWTRPNEPGTWPRANFQYVGQDDGQFITALAPFSDRLLIFKASKTYALYGDFDDVNPNYALSLVSNQVGTRHPFSVALDGDIVYFLADDGVWRYDGNLTYVSRKIKKTLTTIPMDEKKHYAAGVVHDRKYWISVSENGVWNNATYVLDLLALEEGREVWVRMNQGWQVFTTCPADTDYSGKIGRLMGGTYDGYVDKLDSSETDHQSAIQAVMKSAPFHCGTPDERKRFRKIWAWVRMITGYPTMTAEADFGAQVDWQLLNGDVSTDYIRSYRVILDAKMKGNTITIQLHHSLTARTCEVSAVEIQLDERPRR